MVFLELPHMQARKKAPKEQVAKGYSRGAFDEGDGKQEYMAPAMRYFIAEKWSTYSESEKQQIVSQRARRGVSCHVCGKPGYYRENCPNNCISPPATPDSMASTPPATPPPSPPGLGIMWGSLGFDAADREEGESQDKKKAHVVRKADLGPMRGDSIERKEQLRESDFALGGFEFFARADEGYNRTLPELTLHQVMRRLMRLVERQLLANAEKLEAKVDVTLLHPPNNPAKEHFYTEALSKIKEHRDYFIAKTTKNERGDKQAHKFQGHNLPDDQLDGMFRGGAAPTATGKVDLTYYKPNPKAGATMHSKIGWKSILAKSDQLAVSDPNALAKSIEVEQHFKRQGAWTEKQKVDMEQRNDRFEHLVHIIRNEMKEEHNRETMELEGAVEGKKSGKKAQMDVWLARLDAIDRLMVVLREYDIVGALDEADLLVYQVDKWSEVMKTQVGAVESKRNPHGSRGKTADGDIDTDAKDAQADVWDIVAQAVKIERGNAKRPDTEPKKEKKKKKKPNGGNSMMSAGASPYYESEVIFEKAARKSRALAKHWKRPPSRPLTSVSELAAAGDDDDSMAMSIDGHDDDDDGSVGSLDSTDVGFGVGAGGSLDGHSSVESLGASLASSSQSLSQNTDQPRGNSGGGPRSGAAVSVTKKGRVKIMATGRPGALPKGFNVQLSPEKYEDAVEAEKKRREIKKTVKRKYKNNAIMTENDVINTQHDAYDEVKSMKERDKRKQAFKEGWKAPVFHRKVVIPPHEVDEAAMKEAKEKFIAAGLERNIRKGRQTDVAAYVPSLIPVPGAFEGDDTERLSSYAGAKIVDGLQDRMCSDMGHTERRLLPLYVRNTLIEVNGTTANGDQTQEVLSRDRRYSHYHGRPLVRFEPGSELVDSRAFKKEQGAGFGPNKKEKEDKLAPLREEKRKKATEKRIKDQRYKPMNRSLVRLVFGKEPKPADDLKFVDHKI